MGTNEIKQANGIALEKDCMFFCQSFLFHMNEFLNIFFANCYEKCILLFR
jgi:hypothetical protein